VLFIAQCYIVNETVKLKGRYINSFTNTNSIRHRSENGAGGGGSLSNFACERLINLGGVELIGLGHVRIYA